MDVFYLESAHDVSNFEKPVTKNLERLHFRFHSEKVSFFGNRLSQVKVDTSSGTFTSKNQTDSGLFWQTMITTTLGRSPTDEWATWYDQNPPGYEKRPYGMIHFEISNQIVEVIRIYPTVINLFQKIGGVAQIFMFVFVYLMIYNNEIIIELYLLNFGVLMIPQ